MAIKIKICGITRMEDAVIAADAGADFIGLNFWPGTPRCVDIVTARKIADAVCAHVKIVAVFVDAEREHIIETAERLGADFVQLHGSETAEFASSLAPLHIIKAFPVATEADVLNLDGYPADFYLIDAKGGAMPGGTGRVVDWSLARHARKFGRIFLAGGLNPDNVADAIKAAEPYAVDTASGVESAPGIKDASSVRAFIENARGAAKQQGQGRD